MNPFEYLKSSETESLEQLKDWLRIPSISAQTKHKDDMVRAAEWVSDYLNGMGITSQIMPTGGHPVVYGEKIVDDQLPTVLIYGHYDVQPVDPLDLWDSPPFDPVEKDGYILARGAVDDKGQIFAQVKGVESYLKTDGQLPVNVKFLIEGEEEAEAENLDDFIIENKEMLKADIAVISDGAQYGIDLPAITFGLRGISLMEIRLTGPDKDLHSGVFGGAVDNPVNALCRMIGQLHDADNRVTIEGFYDDVYSASDWEREQFDKLPFDSEAYRNKTGAPALWGEKGFSILERTWIRPTLDCNGITGGYQGEGSKTIIPSWASAKLSLRLVPNQDPQDISNKVEAALRKLCPETMKLHIDHFEGAKPAQVSTDGPWLEAAARAVEKVWDKKPFFTKEGGSIPVVETIKSVLGIDTLLVGFGQQDDNAHSPNERFRIKDFHRGCLTAAALLEEISNVK